MHFLSVYFRTPAPWNKLLIKICSYQLYFQSCIDYIEMRTATWNSYHFAKILFSEQLLKSSNYSYRSQINEQVLINRVSETAVKYEKLGVGINREAFCLFSTKRGKFTKICLCTNKVVIYGNWKKCWRNVKTNWNVKFKNMTW